MTGNNSMLTSKLHVLLCDIKWKYHSYSLVNFPPYIYLSNILLGLLLLVTQRQNIKFSLVCRFILADIYKVQFQVQECSSG